MCESKTQERFGLKNPYVKGFSVQMVFKAVRLDEITQGEKADREEKRDQGQSSGSLLHLEVWQRTENKENEEEQSWRYDENCKCGVKEA